ncbi:hypothetical protein AB0436_00850 [Streptomyces sp. NPDC051322]|uniref:hypothetical protein n=1 Tax=Streptomyces sp. NPDC051322 TaxID=3154645 RepID=UPI00344F8591
MSVHRRLGAIAGALLLSLTVAGCSGLGRTAVGPITYVTPTDQTVTVHSPKVTGCHPLLRGGAKTVHNHTLIDMVLYPGRACTGKPTSYNATTLSIRVTPPLGVWRSYSLVH